MMRRTCMIVVFLLALCWMTGEARADDIDIFLGGGSGTVDPNVLIIFDNSGSMSDWFQAPWYDPAVIYAGPYTTDMVYRRLYPWDRDRNPPGFPDIANWHAFRDSIADVLCETARNILLDNGHWENRMLGTSECGGVKIRILRHGNYLNFLVSNTEIEHEHYEQKLPVAQRVVTDLIESSGSARFGLMAFNEMDGGQIVFPIQDIDDTNRQTLIDSVNALTAWTWTPIAETLYEASLYFGGDESYFNGTGTYTSPIEHWCQSNYILLMTDGFCTMDTDVPIGDYDGDGLDPGDCISIGSPYQIGHQCTHYMDDVAQYMYENDFSDEIGEQNVKTYTIGYDIDYELLGLTAEKGGGFYYVANNAAQLSAAFQQAIAEILTRTSAFVSPVVPINHINRTYSGDRIYLALFAVRNGGFWPGNIKKYALATEDGDGYEMGDLLDANGNKATYDNGNIKDTAKSFWSAGYDGLDIELGGVHEKLQTRPTVRNIYTYLGASTDLTAASNAFTKANISAAMLSVPDDTEKDKVVDFVHGYDPYDDDLDGYTSEKREYILGDFLHSRPSVLFYNAATAVIYAGSNDGMLHAFSDTDGSELWAFMPPEFLPRLKGLHEDTHLYMLDSSPQIYFIDNDHDGDIEPGDGDKAYLMIGLRRGGNSYYILNITYPQSPTFVKVLDPAAAGYGELGQTWSVPTLGMVVIDLGGDGNMGGGNDIVKPVAFFGAGYDEAQDDEPPSGDSSGRGVYAIDIDTGDLFWSYTNADNASMNYSIPSRLSVLDMDGNGYMDRLYFGDTGGQLWRFDTSSIDTANWTGKVIFDANPGADASTGRKVLYEPDVIQEKDFEMVYFGTGDRAHPNDTTIVNRFYAVKDTNPASPYDENDLVDVTLDLLQDPGTSEADKETIRSDLNNSVGWYMKLNQNSGEKVLARPMVFGKVAYFSTFTPSTQVVVGDPCQMGDGTARLYAVHYLSATAIMNLDETNGEDLERSDRSEEIGSGIASGTIITIADQDAFGYTSVGGGVDKSDPPLETVILPVSWRQVF